MTEPAAAAPAEPSAPAPWSPDLATAAARLSPADAAARIEALKADGNFYAALRRHDGGAHAEWNELHRALTAQPVPAAPSIGTEADVQAQEQARAAAAWKQSLAELRRNGARFTPEQESDILNRRPISEEERQFHLDTLESYKRNLELGRLVVAKDPLHYTRYHLALQGSQLPVARSAR